MTRLDFKYTDKSEILNDIRAEYPMLPIIPVINFRNAHTKCIGNIEDVEVGEVHYNRELNTIYVKDISGEDYAIDESRQIARNSDNSDSEVIRLTDKRCLEDKYLNSLAWEKAIIIYIGDR